MSQKFKHIIWKYYQEQGRDFPWRRTHDPYAILVSEIMLQQTQTDRVIGFYDNFLKTFPNFRALAHASVADVLRVWQGLGYNRRALMLRETAIIVTKEYHGALPQSFDILKTLPGIGPCTAGAVAAFAFGKPTTFIETNIRAVYIHFSFPRRKKVHDNELLPIIEKTVDQKNPREWYYALMDYGVMLKKKYKNPSRKSAHHTQQSRFRGSNREVRGAILKALVVHSKLATHDLFKKFDFDHERILKNVAKLKEEGFIKKQGAHLVLA